ITCCITASVSFCAATRAMKSVPPPGANGATKRIGFTGYCCAAAGAAASASAQQRWRMADGEWRMVVFDVLIGFLVTRHSSRGLGRRQGRFDARWRKRQVADAHAGGVGDRVGDRRAGWALRAFAAAERALLGAVDEVHLDRRH